MTIAYLFDMATWSNAYILSFYKRVTNTFVIVPFLSRHRLHSISFTN